jgi:anti-sigma B factor antagonist
MEINKLGKIVVIELDELFDAVVAPQFKKQVASLVDSSYVHFIVDMQACKLMDSSGCGALVACLRIVEKNNGDIRIARPSPQARDLFELTRLHRIFEMFDGIEAAVKSYGLQSSSQ